MTLARRFLALSLALSLASPLASAQEDRAIAPAEAAEVAEAAAAQLEKSYVYEDIGRRMAAALRDKARSGRYAGIATARELAESLTRDARAVQLDKHLRIVFKPPVGNPHRIPPMARFGIERDEVLPGNVGYLEVASFFFGGPEVEAAIAESMDRLAGTDALIVDLRRNGGGRPDTVAVLCSYLFDKPVLLNSLYWRERDRTDESWSRAEVRGKRYGEKKPVFVLVGPRTASGAEEFSYNVQTRKRGTIVGETTAGAAHPVSLRELPGDFAIAVPTGRAINPVTGKNWEGVGVVPDVAVPAGEALERARELAAKAPARTS